MDMGKLQISSGASRVLSKHWDFHLMDPKDRYRVLDVSGDWSTRPETLICWLSTMRDTGLSDLNKILMYLHKPQIPLFTDR